MLLDLQLALGDMATVAEQIRFAKRAAGSWRDEQPELPWTELITNSVRAGRDSVLMATPRSGRSPMKPGKPICAWPALPRRRRRLRRAPRRARPLAQGQRTHRRASTWVVEPMTAVLGRDDPPGAPRAPVSRACRGPRRQSASERLFTRHARRHDGVVVAVRFVAARRNELSFAGGTRSAIRFRLCRRGPAYWVARSTSTSNRHMETMEE